MKVYIAAPYGARSQVRFLSDQLRELGMTPTSEWAYGTREIHSGTVHAAADLTDEEVSRFAAGDLHDVGSSDVVVLLTESFSEIAAGGAGSGGRHLETGYALAKGIPVVVVGTPENIFHRSELVFRAATWSDAVGMLTSHQRWLPVQEQIH